jgi:hypothetical protein
MRDMNDLATQASRPRMPCYSESHTWKSASYPPCAACSDRRGEGGHRYEGCSLKTLATLATVLLR